MGRRGKEREMKGDERAGQGCGGARQGMEGHNKRELKGDEETGRGDGGTRQGNGGEGQDMHEIVDCCFTRG